jgi:AraC-like DNA-binding protein/mannose-6-phosphate isomerase-like protein (cupin superfamily)
MSLFPTHRIRVSECYLRRTDATWEHPRHVHYDVNELFFVLKGCLNVATPQGTIEARPHHAVAYPRGLVHRPSSRSGEDLEVIGLAWTGDVSTWEMARLVQHDSFGRIRHQLTWMLDSGPEELADDERVIDLLARSVIVEYNRLSAGEGPDLVVRMRRFMRENLDRPLELEDLARAAGLNRHYFARIFKRVSGASPMRVLMTMRMESARDLLLHTTLPLKYIAAKTGFADEAHMSHTFQRLAGCSPGSLRRRPAGPKHKEDTFVYKRGRDSSRH